MKERDCLESNGFGDQLNEMQAMSWLVKRILNGGLNIDMCFCYRDDEGNETFQWCQGTIVCTHSNKSNDKKYVIAIIQLKDEFVAEGGAHPTKEMSRKNDYNPEIHGNS